MLDLLQSAKDDAWREVMRTHAVLCETRTETAADAHRDALVYWWELSDLFHREVFTRLQLSPGCTSSTGVPR